MEEVPTGLEKHPETTKGEPVFLHGFNTHAQGCSGPRTTTTTPPRATHLTGEGGCSGKVGTICHTSDIRSICKTLKTGKILGFPHV